MRYSLILVGIAAALVGCSKEKGAAGPGAGGPPKMETQVIAVTAKQQPVAETISLVGSVLANEAVEIKSEIDGTVLEIGFKEGQKVEKGQLLVRLDERKLSASVAEAEADFKLSQTTFERTKQLFREKLISQQEYDQAAATFQAREADLDLKRQFLKDARIMAPFSGIAGARMISPGQVISKNSTLTWLNDIDPVKVEMNVPERFISGVKTGQTIEIQTAAFSGTKFKGQVYFVAPALDPTNRTVLVKATVPNDDLQLKPGMLATLDLTLRIRENSIVIPEPAIARVMDNDSAMVFVIDSESAAQMRPVKLGTRLAGQVEILKGIQAGEQVIVEGTQKIGPGSKVKLAPPEAAAPYQQTNGPKS